MSEMEEVGSMIKLVEQAVSLVDTVRKSLQKTGSDGHQDEIDKLFEALIYWFRPIKRQSSRLMF